MSKKSILTALHRFVRLNDKSDSQIFSFIVPTQLTKGFVNEVYSETFLYRNQTWVVKFDHKERHIGAFLLLRAAQNQLNCVIDYGFSVMNKMHFTKNESFTEAGCEFSVKSLCRGRPSFIEVGDLESKHFVFDDGTFLIELELKNCFTKFEDELNLNMIESNNNTIESNYFTYAGCDWSVVLKMPSPKNSGNQTSPEFSMIRHSHFESYCKISYKITVCSPEWPVLTASVEQQLDIKGYGNFFRLRSDKKLPSKSKMLLQVSLNLYSMRQLSIVDILPTSRQRNAGRCYDFNQHDWMIQSDILGSVVKLRFFYMQIANVPKLQTHVVYWDANIIPYNAKLGFVKSMGGPYCAFFSQKESDQGTDVATNLIVEQVCDIKSGYVDPATGLLTIQIEWIQSHSLTHSHYHTFDNIARTHKAQMSREIKTLQSENYALEKQLYKYQQSLVIKKCQEERGLNGNDTVSLSGAEIPCNNDQTSPLSNTYRVECLSPQNIRFTQSNQQNSQRQEGSNLAARSLSPNCVQPRQMYNTTNQQRETERNQMTSPTISITNMRNYVYNSGNDQEYVLDGSAALKRQLPRNPGDVVVSKPQRMTREDPRYQMGSAHQNRRFPEQDRTDRINPSMSEVDYLRGPRSPKSDISYARSHKYVMQEQKDESDSLATRYENRIAAQKKW